jgi:hypothetical protein
MTPIHRGGSAERRRLSKLHFKKGVTWTTETTDSLIEAITRDPEIQKCLFRYGRPLSGKPLKVPAAHLSLCVLLLQGTAWWIEEEKAGHLVKDVDGKWMSKSETFINCNPITRHLAQ